MRQEFIESSREEVKKEYPRPAYFKKALNRIEAIQEKAYPLAERVIDNLTGQLIENFTLHKYNGSEIPYSRMSNADLPSEYIKQKLPTIESDQNQKTIHVFFSGVKGTFTHWLPEATDEIFTSKAVDCYLIGQPTNIDKKWSEAHKKNKLATHGKASADLIKEILDGEDAEKTNLVIHGDSMGTYNASYAAQSLNEEWISKTRLSLRNPPGSHRSDLVNPFIHFGSRVQLGAGFYLEVQKRKRRNKKNKVPDSSLEDREYTQALAPILRDRGIEIIEGINERLLKKAQIMDLWYLGERPPLPETRVRTEIVQGINDLTRLSLRDMFAYKKGEHVRTEGNIILRLSPTSHTVDPLTPKRINSMIEALIDTDELLQSLEEKIMETNWQGDHTYPAPYHYLHLWLWDSAKAANINAQRGEVDNAAIEIDALLNGVDPTTGFIPNMQYRTGRNWHDVESVTFNNPDFGSSYTQPPIIAWSAWETYQAFKKKGREDEGRAFLQAQYEKLDKFYSYFRNYRENGNGSRLIGCTFPHETGRDSDPSLRPEVPFIEGSGRARGLINGLIDYSTVLALNAKLKWKDTYPEKGRPGIRDIVDFTKRKVKKQKREGVRTDWDPEKTREVYWINDVMFNVLYVNNLRYMAKISLELGKDKNLEEYTALADKVEEEILERMWDEETGFFYSLDKNGEQIKVPSISGLFAVNLISIPEDKLTRMVEKMEKKEKPEDNTWFNTQYPFPCVPKHSKYYNPHYEEPRLWKRAEVWIDANQLIGEDGLTEQIQRRDLSPKIRQRIAVVLGDLVEKTEYLVNTDLLENGTTHEMYGEDGTGHRIKGFTWTLGGRHMHKSKALLAEIDTLAA